MRWRRRRLGEISREWKNWIGKREGRTQLDRRKCWYHNNIKMHLENFALSGVDWFRLANDRHQCRFLWRWQLTRVATETRIFWLWAFQGLGASSYLQKLYRWQHIVSTTFIHTHHAGDASHHKDNWHTSHKCSLHGFFWNIQNVQPCLNTSCS
jgi:hypothetical protein